MTPDFLIIGGGVIGLSLAWRLRSSGASVTVIDAGAIGPPAPGSSQIWPGQATWASAGILTPLGGLGPSARLLPVALAGFDEWSNFAELLRNSGFPEAAPQGPGLMRVARTTAEALELQRLFEWQRDTGLEVRWLDSDEARRLDPGVPSNVVAAILSPHEQFSQPRVLLHALAQICRDCGVVFREQVEAIGLARTRARVEGVQTDEGILSGGSVVLCSGAWSAALADIVGFRVPVRPVKGQMMLLHWPSNLHYTLVTPEGFVSPRGGHQLVVGSTEAECLFDTAVRIRELRQLIDFATRFLGSIDEAEIIESWAGLRPGTPDDLPLVGAAPGWENLYVASGHYRKGILMAPLTARLLGELIIDGMRAPLLADLDPGRFAG